jgi:zinc protease
MTPTTRPTAGAPRPYAFPRTERLTLSNGVAVHVASLRRLPTVTALVMVDAGAEGDPLDKAGVASLTASALAEGTNTHDADGLAEAFERLGGALEIDVSWLRAEGSTTVLARRFPDVLRLLAEVIRTPVFPESDVVRLRDERLAELLQQRTEPRGLADDMFSRFVYSPTSRYALPDGGSEETVSLLSPSDVVAHYRARYAPGATTLIVVGDVDPDVVFRLAEEVFGDWQATAGIPPMIIAEAARRERAVHLVAKIEAPQSELRIGHTAVPRAHPDFYALSVMNAILGGLFNSRINLNLRETHAYTYGAYSTLDWRREASAFEISTAVRSDVTADAVREVLGEIARMREEPVGESELSLARDYLTGVFPIRFETTAAIADAIATRESYRLESDYFDTYRSRMAAVTVEEVLRVAQQHLDPMRLQVVAVTDPAAVHDSLDQLGVGPVIDYDSHGMAAQPHG